MFSYLLNVIKKDITMKDIVSNILFLNKQINIFNVGQKNHE